MPKSIRSKLNATNTTQEVFRCSKPIPLVFSLSFRPSSAAKWSWIRILILPQKLYNEGYPENGSEEAPFFFRDAEPGLPKEFSQSIATGPGPGKPTKAEPTSPILSPCALCGCRLPGVVIIRLSKILSTA